MTSYNIEAAYVAGRSATAQEVYWWLPEATPSERESYLVTYGSRFGLTPKEVWAFLLSKGRGRASKVLQKSSQDY